MSSARPQPQSWGSAGVLRHDDGLARCPWAGTDPLYIAYHDEEWGRPEYDSQALFEKLMLDGFQAGLSWITILRKRDAFRQAFVDFNPALMADFNETDINRLMQNPGIVRNRAKIEASVSSARAWLKIEAAQGFSAYLWDFVDGVAINNHVNTMAEIPTQTHVSEKISQDLKSRGFKFCGPTIVYAFMQAVGMVNDHLRACHCRAKPIKS